MKALTLILILPAMMLIGCGQMETNEATASNALQQSIDAGAITPEEASSIDESLLNESVQLSETSSNSVLMKVGGAELLIDFAQNLTGAADEVAMIINGVEVATQVAANPQSLQALIASLVTSQLEQIDISGIPVNRLVQVGLGLINGDSSKADFSNLFGTLIRGVFNQFMAGSPLGSIIGAIAGPILGEFGGSQPNSGNNNQSSGSNNNNNGNNNSGGSLVGGIVDTIGGALTGGNPLLGGIFSLITNLFK